MSFNYFLYVNRYSIFTNDCKFFVYKTNSKDILHTLGEVYRTFKRVTYIHILQYSENLEKWWIQQGFDVLVWQDKYNIGHKL